MHNDVHANEETRLKITRFSVDHAADAIFWIKENGSIAYANQMAITHLGYSMDELLGSPFALINATLPSNESWSSFWHCLKQESVLRFETEHICRGGHRFPVEITASHLCYEAYEYAIACIRDLTSRRQIESQLILAAQVFDTAEEGVIVTDPDDKILFVNPSFTLITGYTENEARGKKPTILQSDKHNPEFYEAMWHQLRADGRWRGEIWNRRKNGEIYLQRMTITAARNDNGEIINYTTIFYDITEQRRSEETIQYQAYHDALTGLPNRTLFKDRLKKALARANRDNRLLAILFIDLDNFRIINDAHGHIAGDEILQHAASRLQECVREGDSVSRLSGDEFTIFLESVVNESDGIRCAEKVINRLNKSYSINGVELFCSVSVGVSFYPSDGDTIEQLMKNADIALGHAKDRGKNIYRMYDPVMNERVNRRLSLENRLRKAIDQNELTVYYQPQVHIRSGRITGWEALVRWGQPDGTILPPAEFIPLAEETSLIFLIGEQVINTACHHLGQQPLSSDILPTVSVNISARRLDREDFPRFVAAALKRSGLPPKQLCIEITESAIMSDMEMALGNLAAIRKLGVKVSMDDFGTGYASLSQLRLLPIDELKIDLSFIRNIPASREEAAITTAIIKMAQTLNLHVVAEGVETIEQLDFLRHAGCDTMQGYYFSPALPADELEAMLRDNKRL